MKAVVLAAGKGIRLGPLAADVPKPLLPVGGRPLISHLLERLCTAGVTDVFMNLHHRGDALRTYCADGARWGLRITYAVETELLGTAGAVRNFGADLTDAPFLVVYGDNYYLDCDIAALGAFHAEHGGVGSIGLFEKDDVTGSGIVLLAADGRIVKFVEKPGPDERFGRLVNGGLYALSPEVLPLIPVRTPCDFGYDVFPALLAARHRLYGRLMEGAVWPIDTPTLYAALTARMGG